MSLPYMPFFTADYLEATGELSTTQHGAYCLLLFHYWTKGKLPDDDAKLARITRMSDKDWGKNRATINEFFSENWVHSRVEKELEKARDKTAKRSEAGANGGKAKSLKNKKAPLAKATRLLPVLPQQTPGKEGSKTLPSSSDSTYQEEANAPSEEEANASKGPPKPNSAAKGAIEYYNDVASRAGWAKCISLTEARRVHLLKRLEECKGIEGWCEAMDRAGKSKFLKGENDRNWKPNVDSFLKQSIFIRLLEGLFDDRAKTKPQFAGLGDFKGGSFA